MNIIIPFVEAARRTPRGAAVRLEGRTTTYADLYELASAIARSFPAVPRDANPLVAILANRTVTAFAGVVGALLSGRGYVPINPAFPPGRIRSILEKTGCRTIVAEPGSLNGLAEALEGSPERHCIIVPEHTAGGGIVAGFEQHDLIMADQLTRGDTVPPAAVRADDLAYVMFTSGSTGTPKGVMTTHANIGWIIDVLQERYRLTGTDRLSLNAELTFSASVLVIFLAFNVGATICCPTRRELLNPAKFIVDEQITVWKCVPSLAALMGRMHQVRANAFPSIRITTFGGESVPADIVGQWAEAAPASVIENVYGSTETSVNATYCRWDPLRSPAQVHRGSVPIGHPLPGVQALVCDEELREVPAGEPGELLLGGPLLTRGYMGDEERTRLAYVPLPGRQGLYYRTGDLVRRSAEGGPLVFLGRRDNQIKVLGNRVELGEIEAATRDALEVREVVALGWPPSNRGFDGIELFVAGTGRTEQEIFKVLGEHLPAYMMPRRIRLLDRLPLNPSGKIDRIALRTTLESERP